MRIENTTPEKIMKDLESARYEESERRRNRGITFAFIIGISLAIWWQVEPVSFKGYGIAIYDFLNNILNQIKAAVK